ncbi:MAG: hypothetical protein FXF47_05320 [Candidatus Mcinerneyibacterium aminivorans]|uniref:Uncharacterized protein n=1 Tax=Candidatus Mcinerneyibacterium aminivorans TaxID=2703815 RepID=A0A5D0MDY6_9BACT|nr:MAG: hypothetical protein FXF47_05320 [Candidatus Mcinerneyibacterium aminivorans]
MSLLQIKNFLKNKNIEIDVRKEAFFLSTFFLKPDKRKDLSINTNFSKFVEDDQVTEEKYSEIKLYREEFVEKYPDLQLGFLPFKRETLDRIMGLILDTSFWDIIFFGQEKKYDDLRNIINYWISKAKINDKVTLGLIEAEKFLFSYPDLFSKFDSDINIYLGDKYLYYIFKFLYESNNKISIYKIHNRGGPENYLEGIELHDENYCWAFPERSRKFSYEDINEEFKSSRKEIIALGNILNSLGDNSILNILLPVGFTFINDTKYMRNNFILDSKNINLKEVFALPKIKNYTSTNVCSLKFEKKQKEEKESIILGRLEKDNSSFKIIDKIELDYDNEMLRTT